MSFLSAVFASEVRAMPSALTDAAAGYQAKASTQLTAALSNVSTKVNLDVSQKVDPGKPGAQCIAQNLKGGAVAAQQEIRGQMNAAFEGIAAAQAQITAAVQAAGMEISEVFPAQSFDESSVAGAMFSAAVAKASGGGTLSTFQEAVSHTSEILDIAADRQGMAPDQAMAKIQEILVEASSISNETKSASFGHLNSADDPGQMRDTQIDWASVFEGASPEQSIAMMKAIMYFDPNKPDPAFFKDVAELVEADAQATNYIAELDNTIEEANRLGTPSYGFNEACYMVQLDRGFANLAFSQAHNPSISPADIAAIKALGADNPDKPPAIDREAELRAMAEKAANWGTAPTPAGQYT